MDNLANVKAVYVDKSNGRRQSIFKFKDMMEVDAENQSILFMLLLGLTVSDFIY